MAKDIVEEAERKVKKEGWMRCWMAVEVLAVTKEAAKSSLEKHMQKIKNEEKCIIYKEEFAEAKKVDNPFKNIKEAYSLVVESEFAVQGFDQLVFLVMNYAPSSIEILEPTDIRIKLGEGQLILNTVSEMVHKFAAAGLGGMMVST